MFGRETEAEVCSVLMFGLFHVVILNEKMKEPWIELFDL
jgi:uncharacterized protein YhhL (DUF1145 family)